MDSLLSYTFFRAAAMTSIWLFVYVLRGIANLSSSILGYLFSLVIGSRSANKAPISTPRTPPSKYSSIPRVWALNSSFGTLGKILLASTKTACPPTGVWKGIPYSFSFAPRYSICFTRVSRYQICSFVKTYCRIHIASRHSTVGYKSFIHNIENRISLKAFATHEQIHPY